MEAQGAELEAHLRTAARAAGLALSVSRIGSALQVFLGLPQAETLADTARADRDATLDFTGALLLAGVQTLPRGLMYLSAAHTDADIAATKAAFDTAIARAAR
jgi:glutamate-1-semialdehyde 2,1-aminomutase